VRPGFVVTEIFEKVEMTDPVKSEYPHERGFCNKFLTDAPKDGAPATGIMVSVKDAVLSPNPKSYYYFNVPFPLRVVSSIFSNFFDATTFDAIMVGSFLGESKKVDKEGGINFNKIVSEMKVCGFCTRISIECCVFYSYFGVVITRSKGSKERGYGPFLRPLSQDGRYESWLPES